MNINLEYYKIFYYVAKKGGITAAANELSVSQPAVSQAIKTLEELTGLQLFFRTSHGVSLTSEGHILFDYVSRGYEEILAGERKLEQMKQLDFGELRIGASDMTLRFFLLPYLEAYHRKYPKIKVEVTNAPTPQTIEHLLSGRIDFGVVSGPLPENLPITKLEAAPLEDIFIAGPKYWELKSRRIGYETLAEYPYICLDKETSTRKYVDSFLQKEGAMLTPEFELATSDMIVQFVRRNLGIGSVVKSFADDYIASGEIFQLTPRTPIPSRHMYVISDSRIKMNLAAERMMKILQRKA